MSKVIIGVLSIALIFPFDKELNVGEILKYEASFSNINAGEGSLKVFGIEKIRDNETYHVQFKANTKGLTNKIFPIRDVIDLWLDKKSLLPLRVKSSIREGRYRKEEDVYLFQKDNYALKNNKKILIKENTHSPFSLFYFFRSLNIKNFGKEKIEILQGNRIETLYVNIKEDIHISVPAGTFRCIRITPTKIEGEKFKNEAKMDIYFSDDIKSYPVKIKIKLKFGSLILKLKEISS